MDEAKYECHVNSEPPLKLAICLTVQGLFSLFLFNLYFLRFSPLKLAKMSPVSPVMALLDCFYLSVVSHFGQNFPFSVPKLRVTDGFGRPLADQYYKAGSSLEVVCQVCHQHLHSALSLSSVSTST